MTQKNERIDNELQKLNETGKTPKAIHVGLDLFNELYDEIKPVYAAPSLGLNDKAPVYEQKEVKAYNGVPVEQIFDVPNNYLKIIA